MTVVVVSGANRGTGKSIAREFYEHDATVVALNKTLCKESWIHELRCDVRSLSEIKAGVKDIIRKFGSIDIVVNNAAIRRFGRLDELSDEQWKDSVDTNLNGVFWLTREVAPHLISSHGLLVFIGSHAGMHFVSTGAAYCCTKAAVHALAEVAIKDLRHRGVRVTLIAPGPISNRPEKTEGWKIRPEELAKFVVYLSTLSHDIIPGFVELRPAQPPPAPSEGLDALQYI